MKNILLIGLGRFGRHIALQLNKLGHEVMAVDSNEERVNKILPIVTNAQIGDSTNTEFLKSLGIGSHHRRKFSKFAGNHFFAERTRRKISCVPRRA